MKTVDTFIVCIIGANLFLQLTFGELNGVLG